MGFDNKYPYTDFHELNLDWFLQEFNKLLQEWADLAADNEEFKHTMTERFSTLDKTVKEFIQFVNNYFDNLDVQQEINNKLNDMVEDGTMSELLRPYFNAFTVEINARMRNQDDRIAVLEGRMDTFTHLTEGSTTGDAELMDIRVGYDGNTYQSAGVAVREQIKTLHNFDNNVFTHREQLFLNSEWTTGKAYVPNGTTLMDSATYKYYSPVYLEAGTYYISKVAFGNTNIKIGETIETLAAYGVVQTADNRNCVLTLADSGYLYASTPAVNQPMISKYPITETYIDGIYYDTEIKNDVLPEYLQELYVKDVTLNKIQNTNFSNFNGASVFTRTSTGFHAENSSNAGGQSETLHTIDYTRYETNLNIEFDLSVSVNNSTNLYLFYTKTGGGDALIPIMANANSGHKNILVDLAYYEQYMELGSTFKILINCNNSTSWVMDVSNFELVSKITQDNVGDNAGSYLNYLNGKIDVIETEMEVTKPYYLTSPDGDKYILNVDDSGNINGIPVIPDKTLFIGNSLLLGNITFGLAASDEDHDYAHYVENAILDKNADATFEKLLGVTFEGATNTAQANNWMTNTLLPYLQNDPDLVIIQLGDNVAAANLSVFRTNAVNLIKYIRNNTNARVVWAGIWYTSNEKTQIIVDACEKTGIYFINFTDLNIPENRSTIGNVMKRTVEQTYTFNCDSYIDDNVNHVLSITFTHSGIEYTSEVPYTSYTYNSGNLIVTGYYVLIQGDGTASHPGNEGMLAISERIISELGIDY